MPVLVDGWSARSVFLRATGSETFVMRLFATALAATALLVSWSMAFCSGENVTVVKLRQTDDSLRDTYAKGKRMGLPRMVMLDGKGQAVYTRAGFSEDLTHRLHKALDEDRNVEPRINLDLILSETVRVDGRPITSAELPSADAYVIDYWASWCGPCHELKRKLESALHTWDGKTFVWLEIESDPKKLLDR